MGLFDTSQSSSTKFKPSKQQKSILDPAVGYLQDFAQNGVTLPTGSGVTDFNATQQAAQQQALGAVGGQDALGNAGAGFSNWLFSGAALDPNSNPALQGTIDAATRPIFQGLTEQVLPALRGESRTNGVFGSNRQGIAEGLASRGALSSAGDASSNIAYQGYQQGLQAMMQNLGLLPQTQGALTTGAATTGAVGDARYSLDQAKLTDARNQDLQRQLLPLSIGQELLAALGAIPGGKNVSKNTSSASPLTSILGAGATIASAIP